MRICVTIVVETSGSITIFIVDSGIVDSGIDGSGIVGSGIVDSGIVVFIVESGIVETGGGLVSRRVSDVNDSEMVRAGNTVTLTSYFREVGIA
jgi:hypothetical protein